MRRLLGTPEGFVFGLLSTLSDLFRLHTERFRLCLSFLRQTLLVRRCEDTCPVEALLREGGVDVRMQPFCAAERDTCQQAARPVGDS